MQRVDPHVYEWMNLRESAGDPVDLDDNNKLCSDAFTKTLPTADDMNELCCNHDGDNPHDIIAEEIGSGQLRYFEHIIKRYQQLDRTYHNRAVSRGVVGAAYWKPGKGRRRRGAPISAVSRREN